MRKLFVTTGLIALAASGLDPRAALAAEVKLDGSAPLLCAVIEVMDCSAGNECQRRTAEDVNVPQFIKVDAKAKTISAPGPGGRSAPIHTLAQVDGKLVLHGGQEGRGWSAVIVGETGKMSAGVVDDRGGFVIFGACTAP